MNELALFAGAGGGILGGKLLGWRTVCAVEWEQYPASVLVQRQNDGFLPPFPIWDDVRTFDGKAWRGSVDVVSGGFPCQAFSTASRGRRTADNLWPEMRRIIGEVDPRYVFAENVSHKAIEHAADDLEEMGYQAELLSLSAADVGADHVRERYWLLAYTDDKSQLRGCLNAEMAEREGLRAGIWATGPNRSRMVDGMAGRMERYRATGNGQVPLVAAAALWSFAHTDAEGETRA